MMYEVLGDKLATLGIGEKHYPMRYIDCRTGEINGFEIVDVRTLRDEPGNSLGDYMLNIQRVISYLQIGKKVVICCGAGQSRSNAIALGVLVQHFKMDFFGAWDLIRERVPICQIEPCHIAALKQMFKVTLP